MHEHIFDCEIPGSIGIRWIKIESFPKTYKKLYTHENNINWKN